MPRKAQSKPAPAAPLPAAAEIVPAAILAVPAFYPPSVRVAAAVPCVVCRGETRSDLVEQLCWVCRRLKISAWRDSEPMPVQE